MRMWLSKKCHQIIKKYPKTHWLMKRKINCETALNFSVEKRPGTNKVLGEPVCEENGECQDLSYLGVGGFDGFGGGG